MNKILLLFIVGLYITFYAGMYCFYHTHDLSWGTIAHSHPYSSANHTHTENALQLINSFTNTFLTGFAAVTYFAFFLTAALFFTLADTRLTPLPTIRCSQGRAPPIN